MFKNPKIAKKIFSKKRKAKKIYRKKMIAKHLANIKLQRRTSFGSMLDELSFQGIEE